MPNLSVQEIVEMRAYKAPEVPHNNADDLASAMKKARDERNAQRRAAAKDQQQYISKEIAGALSTFEQAVPGFGQGSDTPQNKTVTETTPTRIETPVADNDATEVNQSPDDSGTDPLKQMVTRQINGKAVTKSLAEWLDTASKVEQADDYLNQAASHLNRTKTTKSQAEIEEEQRQSEADDLALFKALQTGTDTEGLAAIRKLRNQAATNAHRTVETESIKERGRVVFEKVRAAHTDLHDPNLWSVVVQKDKELANAGRVFDAADPVHNFELRMTEACRQAREWVKSVKASAATENKRQELIDKKAKIAQVQTNNQRAAAPKQPTEQSFESEEAYREHVRKQLERKKHQMKFGR
jgi:hypothetical protein